MNTRAAQAERITQMRDLVDYNAEYRAKFKRAAQGEQELYNLAREVAGDAVVVLPGKNYLAEVGPEKIEYRRMVRRNAND
jgi:hypothetical protein